MAEMADSSLESQILGVAISLMLLPLPFVALRFYARKLKKAGIGLDDWVLLWALLVHVAICVALIVCTTVGDLGHHSVFSPKGIPVITQRHLVAFKLQYTAQILSVVADGSIKISLLLLYRRIFVVRSFLFVSAAMMVLIICWITSFIFATIFQCNPISTFWNEPFGAGTPGKCIDIVALYISTAITGLITDVMVLVLPIPMVLRLHLPLLRRIFIALIFLLGLIYLVFGAIRIKVFSYVLHQIRTSFDYSYLFPKTFYWSTAETAVGIVCACLPTIAPVFDRKIRGSLASGLASWPLLSRAMGRRKESESSSSQSDRVKQSETDRKALRMSTYPSNSFWKAESPPIDDPEPAIEMAQHCIHVKHEVFVGTDEQSGAVS